MSNTESTTQTTSDAPAQVRERVRRRFLYNGAVLGDPDPGKSIADVQKLLAVDYPELTSATHTETTKDGVHLIEFTRAVKTKG